MNKQEKEYLDFIIRQNQQIIDNLKQFKIFDVSAQDLLDEHEQTLSKLEDRDV